MPLAPTPPRTFAEWRTEGYRIKPGFKPTGRNKFGIPTYPRSHVELETVKRTPHVRKI